MKGDFSRDTFDARKHYSRVLYQQGRVTLDADPNEQTSILLHYLRTLAQDLIGPHGGPVDNVGFAVTENDEGELLIGAGRYYVDGILVENEEEGVTYLNQPYFPVPEDDPLRQALADTASSKKDFWLYLDVWERHITPIEDGYVREKALLGPHTCTRAQVIWQLKAIVSEGSGEGGRNIQTDLNKWRREQEKLLKRRTQVEGQEEIDSELRALDDDLASLCATLMSGLNPISPARMAARVDPGRAYEDPCELSPEAKYRGTENQLYRVEIHRSGKAGQATFKWSRDNGSVVTAWLGTIGNDLRVASTQGFGAGNWVELSNDHWELRGEPGVLVKLAKVEGDLLSVDPASIPSADALTWSELLVNPKIRRWDQTEHEDVVLVEGAVPISETSPDKPFWIDLEDGVQVQFAPEGVYRSGDYWLIPARVATGDIEWPGEDTALVVPPKGVLHHYAPIGFIGWRGQGFAFTSCRCEFDALAICGNP